MNIKKLLLSSYLLLALFVSVSANAATCGDMVEAINNNDFQMKDELYLDSLAKIRRNGGQDIVDRIYSKSFDDIRHLTITIELVCLEDDGEKEISDVILFIIGENKLD